MIEQLWVFLEQNPTPSEPQTTNHVHVRPSRPSVVLDRKCAHCGSLNCDSTQIVPFADTPACNTVDKVSMWCLFCCDAADGTQTCYLLLRILFERDWQCWALARLSAVVPFQSHFSKNGSLGACDPDLAMHP